MPWPDDHDATTPSPSSRGKILFFGMVGLLGLLLAVNFAILDKNEHTARKRVAVFFPGFVEFFDIQQRAMLDAATTLDLELVTFNAGWNAYDQMHQLEKALSTDLFDAIALCAVDNEALTPIFQVLDGVTIPFVTFTNEIGATPHDRPKSVRTHIGRDEVYAGHILGQAVDQLQLETTPRIVMIQGAPGTAPQRFRSRGFQEVLAQHPEWRIVEDVLIPGWDVAHVEREVQQILDTGTPVNVFVTQWAGAAVAVADVLKRNKVTGIRIVTLEFNAALKSLMEEGLVHFTSFFSVAEEGRRTIEVVHQLLQQKPVDTFIEITQTVVSPREASQLIPES